MYCQSVLYHSCCWLFYRGPSDVIGDCKLVFLDEIYQVEKPGAPPLSATDGQFKRRLWCKPSILHHVSQLQVKQKIYALLPVCVCVGKSGPECKHCKADPDAECRFCSCCVCGGKQDAHMQLLCDECNMAFHLYCLNPPLSTIPEDEDWWEHTHVPRCINTVWPCRLQVSDSRPMDLKRPAASFHSTCATLPR